MRLNNRRVAGLVFCGLLALAACPAAFGQGPRGGGPGGFPPPGGGPPHGGPRRGGPQGPRPEGHRPPPPRGPHADLLSTEMRFGDRPVKGVPYSGQFVSESTRTLGDGTRITRGSTGAVYRDTAGRTRREMKIDSIGPVAIEGGPRQMVFINDWVARVHYVLDEAQRVARKLPLPEELNVSHKVIQGADENSAKEEDLGKRTIEGLEVEGHRLTVTVPAGRVGNDRPLEFISERWFSPELKLVVLSIHRDPYVGDNVYRLTNITRAEPAASLFDIPADFTVLEGPPKNAPRRPRPEE